MQERRKYTLEQRAAALAAMDSGLKLKQVARELGIPLTTVSGWRSKAGLSDSRSEKQRDEEVERLRSAERERMREDFSRIVTLTSQRVIEALSEGKMGARDAAWAGAVAFDKVALLDGRPTAITADTDLASFLKGAGYEAERRKLRVVKGGKQEAEAS